jgi:ribosomal protein S12 methylthiotransferase accessory factor
MESSFSLPHVKIGFKPGVSQFNSKGNDSLFVKHDNRLFKISTASDLEKQSRIFHILERPRRLAEILRLLSEFKRKDVIGTLQTLDKLDLLDIGSNPDNDKSELRSNNSSYHLQYHTVQNKSHLSNSRLVLIGDGILAEKLALSLRNTKISFSKTSSKMIEKSRMKMALGQTNVKNAIETEPMYFFPESLISTIEQADLIVVAQDYHDLVLFERVNQMCFRKQKPWLRASFDDSVGYVGPLVIPRKTSCFNCCELRLVTNSPNYEYELWINRQNIPKGKLLVPKYFADILTTICTNEISAFLSRHKKPQTVDNLIVLDTHDLNTSRHKVLTHPNCICCNPPRRKTPSKSLQKVISKANRRPTDFSKVFNESRLLPDQELLKRLRQIVDEKTGIVLEYSKLYEPNPLGITLHHFSTAPCSIPLRIGLNGQPTRTVNIEKSLISPSPSGSGFSPTEAEIHTLMESVERYSNMVVDESRLVWATFENISESAIDPRSLCLYSDEQYYQSDSRCSRFSRNLIIPWIDGYDLYGAMPVMIPADFVFYPAISAKPLVFDTSNGASAHTDTIKAILNGLFEVIERDSFLVMWLNGFSMPILKINDLPYGFAESIKRINEQGMYVKLVNLTIDTNIPTVAAICYNKNPDKYPSVLVGAGSHIDPEKAVQKALFEMEFMITEILEHPDKEKVTSPEDISSMYKHPLYYLNPKMRKYWEFMISSKKTSKLPRFDKRPKDDNETLMKIVKLLHSMNHRVIYVDITSSELSRMGVKAVKVFVTDFQPLYVGTRRRLNLRRLNEAAKYVTSNIKATRLNSELNSAPHPLP